MASHLSDKCSKIFCAENPGWIFDDVSTTHDVEVFHYPFLDDIARGRLSEQVICQARMLIAVKRRVHSRPAQICVDEKNSFARFRKGNGQIANCRGLSFSRIRAGYNDDLESFLHSYMDESGPETSIRFCEERNRIEDKPDTFAEPLELLGHPLIRREGSELTFHRRNFCQRSVSFPQELFRNAHPDVHELFNHDNAKTGSDTKEKAKQEIHLQIGARRQAWHHRAIDDVDVPEF